jgi:hypothetical protein
MTDARVDNRYRAAMTFFIALWLTIPFYVGIATFIAKARDPARPIPNPELARDPFSQPLVFALIGVAVVLLAVTPIIRGKLMPPRSYGGPRLELSAALSRLVVAQLFSWMLTEVIAVLGLILSLLSYEPAFVYAFGGVAALVMLAYAPSRRLHDEVVRVATA